MTIGICIAIVVLGVGGAVAYRLAHRVDHSTPPAALTKTVTVQPQVANPRTVVEEFYNDINNKHYAEAWRLTSQTGGAVGFANFKAGYNRTVYDTLNVESVNGDVVTFTLTAQQTNGTVKQFAGTYTVTNGIIRSAKVGLVS